MKDIVAVTGKYEKDGQEKAEFTKIGAIGVSQSSGKEFVLLDPSVSIAGVLAKQNALALERGEQQKANVICSVIDRANRQQPQQQDGYQQPQQRNQGYQQQPPAFDDDVPF